MSRYPICAVGSKIENAPQDILDLPDEAGNVMKLPTSVQEFLRKSKREKRLEDWIMATGVDC
jgi:hypothetical protein